MTAPTKDTRSNEKAALKRAKAKQKLRYAAYKEHRKAQLSVRTVTCPPELSVPTARREFFGTLCRFLVVLFAVFGMTYFVCDAFGYNTDYVNLGLIIIRPRTLFFYSLLVTSLCALPYFIRNKSISVPLTVLGLSGLTVYFFYLNNGLILPQDAFTAAFNYALTHMADLGYYALGEKLLPFSVSVDAVRLLAPYIQAAVFAFLLLVAILYTTCLMRRIRLWQLLTAGFFSALVMFVIFEYNITKSNWGVTLLIASFSGALVMAAYDFLFLRKRKTETDGPFAPDDAPAVPAILKRKLAAKTTKQQDKKDKSRKKAEKKTEVRTVEDEISDFFSTGKKRKAKPEKEKKRKLSAAEKKEKREKETAERQELRAYRTYYRKKTAAACAAGGFSGFAVFALAMLFLFLPTLTSTGPNTLFDRAGKSFEAYREYITAKLMGDEPVLNTLAYERDERNFEAQDTAPHAIYYSGEKLMTVESNLRNAVYLRGWLGTVYNNTTGAWTTPDPDSNLYKYYREHFGTESAPAEDMLYGFWNLVEPGSIPDPTVYEYTKMSKANSSLGFTTAQINIRREKDFKSKTLFMPVFSLSRGTFAGKSDNGTSAVFLRQYGTAEQSKISYANIFDGIYSAYGLTRKNDGIATVSTLTTMKSEGFYRTLAENIEELHNYTRFLNGTQTAEIPYGQGYTVIRNDFGDDSIRYRTEYRTADGASLPNGSSAGSDGFLYIVIPQEIGDAVYKISGGKVLSKTVENIPEDKKLDEDGEEIIYRAPDFPLAVYFAELASPEETAAAKEYLQEMRDYTNFVQQFYPTSQENTRIHELAETILANATKEVSEPYQITDPESGEVYESTHKVEVHAEYPNANGFASALGASYTADNVRERHELVMQVINWLTDEDNFTYTLTPKPSTDASLVGVEQFLFDTHEGSCVQYATAAALILRDCGIPVRFASGYIATNFNGSTAEGHAANYVTSVRDRDAHAWIEVWYDYVGWIPYECTPVYYGEMYYEPAKPYDPSDYNIPDDPGEDDPGIDEPVEPQPQYTPEQLAEMERQRVEAEWKAAIKKIVTIVLIAVAAAAAIALFLWFFWRRAKKAQAKRDALVAKIAAAGTAGAPEVTREEFRAFSELVTYLLALCKLTPRPGEFRDEYAARLAKDCHTALSAPVEAENIKDHDKLHYVLTEERTQQAFAAVAAEEFGFGAAPEDMPLLARFYRRMRAFEYPHRVSLFKRVWLWFFVNKM